MNVTSEFINRFQSGDERVLEALIREHKEPLFRFILRYLGDASEAADVVSETFIKAWRNRANYKPSASMQTWLFSIGVNVCRDRARTRRRHPGDFVGKNTEDSLAVLAKCRDPASTPDEEAITQEEEAFVRRAIDALPHDLKAAFLLAVLEGLPQSEVAALLNCSRKTIETRVYRARKKLRSDLERYHAD